MTDRTRKPVEQTDFKFHPPAIEHFSLDNGLKVYFIERDHLPIVRISLMIDAGSKFDPHDKKGLANLLTMTFDEGAGDLTGLELSDEFELLGSNFDTGCNHDSIILSLRSLKENFDRSLQLFSDVLLKPHLDEVSFAREKRKILTRVLQLKDDPDEIANQVFEYILFGPEDTYAYPISGSENTLVNITCEDVRQYYKNYVLPNNSSLIVIGNLSKSELVNKLNKHFASWKKAPYTFYPDGYLPLFNKKIYLINKENAVQTEIRAGHSTGKREREGHMSKIILNTVLGGQFSSRINLNLREKKGYTYGASSNFVYYKDRGYFVVSTSVGKDNTANAVEEIIKELESIRGGITPEELAFTRSSILRKFPSNFETNRQIAVNVSRLILHSLPLDHFDTYLDNVKSVTLEDVQKTAAENILPGKLSVVIVGDKKVLLDQFEKAGLGPVTELDHNGNKITAV